MPARFKARRGFGGYEFFARIPVVKSGIVKLMVVIPDQVERARLYDLIAFTGIVVSSSNWPGSVQAMHNASQLRRDTQCAGVALLWYLVADAPDEHAGMVTVAQHLVSQVAFMPFLKV